MRLNSCAIAFGLSFAFGGVSSGGFCAYNVQDLFARV